MDTLPVNLGDLEKMKKKVFKVKVWKTLHDVDMDINKRVSRKKFLLKHVFNKGLKQVSKPIQKDRLHIELGKTRLRCDKCKQLVHFLRANKATGYKGFCLACYGKVVK